MKALKPIFISLILALFLGTGFVLAKNGHKITNMTVVTDPTKPEKGTPVDTLTVDFKLKSSTGISDDRIKLYVNSTPVTLSSENITIDRLTDEDDTVNGLEFANITIEKPEVNFGRIDNNLEVLYLITAISTDPPQARKSKTVTAKDSTANSSNSGGSNSGGSNSGSSNGGGSNGDTVTITPRLFRLIVTDVNGDGIVSSSPRQFKITAYHDERIIASVDKNGYNAITHPIISNLKIYEQNVNDKSEKTLVTDDFSFSLEGNGSESSSQYDSISNELKTVFISDEMTITDRKNLLFKLNLNKLVENSGVKLEDNIIVKQTVKHKITAQELDFNTLTIVENGMDFNITSNKKKKYFYDSDSFTITGTFNGTESVSSIDEIEYLINSSKPKLKNSLKKSKKLSATGSNGGTASISGTVNGGYTVTIPTILSTKSTISSLRQKGFTNSTIDKEMKIPVTLITKTSNGLDLIVNGTVLMDNTLIFNLPDANGSSL